VSSEGATFARFRHDGSANSVRKRRPSRAQVCLLSGENESIVFFAINFCKVYATSQRRRVRRYAPSYPTFSLRGASFLIGLENHCSRCVILVTATSHNTLSTNI
jgi:hypothetical protein